ncbi:MAG TPA: tetratricopeptide repeat protein [Gemmatimonadaceae bacterium]|nr:tetratricopeptide repeat protein [Gemmatimonadaceae bacterium]
MKFRLQVGVFALFAAMLFSVPLRAQSIEQGIQLFDARKYAEARAVLLSHGGSDARAAYYLGRIEMQDDDADKAAEWFERAVKMNPKSAVYYDWLGRAYAIQTRNANIFRAPSLARKTRSALETALALDPDNLDVRDDLITYYTRAPGFVGGSKAKAREMALEIKKRNAYRGATAAANICAAEKDSVCVERELQAMVTSYPDSAAVYASLAAFYVNQKEFDKAFAVLDQRLRMKPNELTTLYQVGRTASLSGQNLDQGERALKTYLANPTPERGPAPAHVHYRLGLIYEKKGSKELAREEYRAALQLNPKHQDARKALAALK